jgi:hypothetical protein
VGLADAVAERVWRYFHLYLRHKFLEPDGELVGVAVERLRGTHGDVVGLLEVPVDDAVEPGMLLYFVYRLEGLGAGELEDAFRGLYRFARRFLDLFPLGRSVVQARVFGSHYLFPPVPDFAEEYRRRSCLGEDPDTLFCSVAHLAMVMRDVVESGGVPRGTVGELYAWLGKAVRLHLFSDTTALNVVALWLAKRGTAEDRDVVLLKPLVRSMLEDLKATLVTRRKWVFTAVALALDLAGDMLSKHYVPHRPQEPGSSDHLPYGENI